MNDQLNKAIDEAYASYLAGCEKRNAAVIWSLDEWHANSKVAEGIRQQFWSLEYHSEN